ncbi:hypothetical protein GDO81_004407 [Engystomops pustulosus]|uniref:Uncharacterized protein n=1 Tax=Engystomops pustulosus TaxID=76066 RepID=A0AAV6ZUD6_ENGPU|nr:hypothetical protein GDO81_004407 [Engystomops pustulosus]
MAHSRCLETLCKSRDLTENSGVLFRDHDLVAQYAAATVANPKKDAAGQVIAASERGEERSPYSHKIPLVLA